MKEESPKKPFSQARDYIDVFSTLKAKDRPQMMYGKGEGIREQTEAMENMEDSGKNRQPSFLQRATSMKSMSTLNFKLRWAIKRMVRRFHGLSVPLTNDSSEAMEEWEKSEADDQRGCDE